MLLFLGMSCLDILKHKSTFAKGQWQNPHTNVNFAWDVLLPMANCFWKINVLFKEAWVD